MDRVLENVRSWRRRLRLRPRAELIKVIGARMGEVGAQPSGPVPPYVCQFAEEAVRDLAEAGTEEELAHKAARWIRDGLDGTDKARRLLRTWFGSLILMAQAEEAGNPDGKGRVRELTGRGT